MEDIVELRDAIMSFADEIEEGSLSSDSILDGIKNFLEIADRLGVSSSSIQRRLVDEGLR